MKLKNSALTLSFSLLGLVLSSSFAEAKSFCYKFGSSTCVTASAGGSSSNSGSGGSSSSGSNSSSSGSAGTTTPPVVVQPIKVVLAPSAITASGVGEAISTINFRNLLTISNDSSADSSLAEFSISGILPYGVSFENGILSGTISAPTTERLITVSVSYKGKSASEVYTIPAVSDYAYTAFKDLAAIPPSVAIKSSDGYLVLRQSIGTYYRYIRSTQPIYKNANTQFLRTLGTVDAAIYPQKEDGVFTKYTPSKYTWTAITKNAPCLNTAGLIDAIAVHSCGSRNGYIFSMDVSGDFSTTYALAPWNVAPYSVGGAITAVFGLNPSYSPR